MKKFKFLFFFLLITTIGFGQTTIFSENCGNPGSTTSASIYTGWQNNATLTYAASATYPDVRTSTPSTGYTGASGYGNIYFNATSVTGTSGTINVVISNINTSSYTNLVLSFGFLKNTNAWLNEVVVEVSSNGTTWTSLTISPSTGSGTANVWQYLIASGSIPSASNLRIRFRYAATSSTTTVRFDDIKLVGCLVPSIPTPSYTSPACSSSFINLPSNSYVELHSGDTSKIVSSTITSSGTYYAKTVSVTSGCASVWSKPDTFSVVINSPSPTITINPVSVYAASVLNTYDFISHANYPFIWQLSTNSGTSWNNLTISSPYSTHGDTLNLFPVSQSMNNYQYRILSTNGACLSNSSAAKLTISSLLPVKLEYFTAYKDNNESLLKWATATEINNYYFDIERSVDGITFESLSKVYSLSSNSNTELSYQFSDKSPLNGTNYYRLKQVDLDGNFEYSWLVPVDFTINNNLFLKYYDLEGREVSETLPFNIYIRNLNGKFSKVIFSK